MHVLRNRMRLREKLEEKFPEPWRAILAKRVIFYQRLNEADRKVFEKRVQLFLATKYIEGVEAEVDDTARLFVASSAIIPMFAFPEYTYPRVRTILIYPNSFDDKYDTDRADGTNQDIIGQVSNRFQDGTVILSKPDLERAFDGLPHKGNVGIHEFVHMLDKEDGDIDGVPEILLQHQYVAPWLREIKEEVKRIEQGKSDINVYALTNNAEFLAVVSEYFFDNPEKFKARHPELYQQLSGIFKQNPGS